jgi:hypothetical protein
MRSQRRFFSDSAILLRIIVSLFSFISLSFAQITKVTAAAEWEPEASGQ